MFNLSFQTERLVIETWNHCRRVANHFNLLVIIFDPSSVTETYVTQFESGVPDEYDNYSDLVRFVQRNVI